MLINLGKALCYVKSLSCRQIQAIVYKPSPDDETKQNIISLRKCKLQNANRICFKCSIRFPNTPISVVARCQVSLTVQYTNYWPSTKVFLQKQKEYPDKQLHPNFYHWYIVMRQFADSAREGWIREKRYIDNQSEKCLMLIADIFAKQGMKALHTLNRNKSLDTALSSLKPQKSHVGESTTLKAIDMNNAESQPLQKVEYRMIVELRHVQNIEELFERFYKLKQIVNQPRIKIKQLNFHNKHGKSIFLRFVTEKNNFQTVKQQIDSWIEVRRILSKQSIEINHSHEKIKLSKTVSIR